MNIGLVAREYPPFYGGGLATYLGQLARALADLDHRVHVFTIGEGGTRDVAGVHVHSLPRPRGDLAAKGYGSEWFAADQWFAEADLFRGALRDFTEQLDLLEFCDLAAPGWLYLLDRRRTVPAVVDCHTPIWLLRKAGGRPPLAGWELELLQLYLAEAVTCPSQAMTARLAAKVALPHGPQVLPHLFDADQFCAEYQKPGAGPLLFVGRLEPLKGVFELLAAMRRVWRSHPECELWLAGDDTQEAPGGGSMRKRLAAELSPDEQRRVRFLGKVSPKELSGLYRQARFCVFPSRFDNFPSVALEAMACGRTAVVARGTGFPEIMGEAGVTVAAEDAEESAAAIMALLSDTDRLERLSLAAFRRVRTLFAPAKLAAERIAFYHQVVESHDRENLWEKAAARVPKNLWETTFCRVAEAVRLLHRNFDSSRQSGRAAADKLADLVGRHGGPGRYALYGAGAHSKKLLTHRDAWQEAGIEVVKVLDDNPATCGLTLGGLPVVAAALKQTAGLAGVILSSDTAETALWEKTAAWRRAGVRVFRLHFTR